MNVENTSSVTREALSHFPSGEGCVTFVTGIRGCGKSTLIRQAVEKYGWEACYYDFDWLERAFYKPVDLDALFDERIKKLHFHDTLVFQNGIERHSCWKKFVNACCESRGSHASMEHWRRERNKHYGYFRVIVECINPRSLVSRGEDLFAGHRFDAWLRPFGFREYCQYRQCDESGQSFREYLEKGGFPGEHHLYIPDSARAFFREFCRDVVIDNRLESILPFSQLAAYLLHHIGEPLSPTDIRWQFGIGSPKTVLDYFDLLTQYGLVARLEYYAESRKSRMLRPKKVYACDTGLLKAFDADLRIRFENVVYWAMRTRGGDLAYFDSPDGKCDFVRTEGSHAEAVQACCNVTDENRGRECNGLVAAMDRLGCKEGVIVTLDQTEDVEWRGHPIRIVPFAEWNRGAPAEWLVRSGAEAPM